MSVIIFAGIIGLCICFYFIQKTNHENKINEKIESIGGTVISIEHRSFSTGPFIMAGKGRTVYRIEYSTGSEEKEGWVKFGGMFGPDWR